MNRMRRDLGKVRDELIARQAKPVKLRVAASMAHYELTGRKRDAILARDFFREVAEMAKQLALISDLYCVNEAHRLVRVPPEEVERGTFENGGDVLRTPDGAVYRSLSMRRIDVMDALAALKMSRAALDRQGAVEKEKA